MRSEEELKELYNWVDSVPLSRAKRNISRDFADAVLTAEIIYHFEPQLIELHNYAAVNSVKQKEYNWQTLNKRALKPLGVALSLDEMAKLASAKQGAIEDFLLRLKARLDTLTGGYSSEARDNGRNYEIETSGAMKRSVSRPQTQKNKFRVIDNGEEMKNEVLGELKDTVEVEMSYPDP